MLDVLEQSQVTLLIPLSLTLDLCTVLKSYQEKVKRKSSRTTFNDTKKIRNPVDILLISDTKTEESLPKRQFFFREFNELHIIDKNTYRGRKLEKIYY